MGNFYSKELIGVLWVVRSSRGGEEGRGVYWVEGGVRKRWVSVFLDGGRVDDSVNVIGVGRGFFIGMMVGVLVFVCIFAF